MSFNTVSVIGLGYIGLPTAAMFASRKKKVIGVDVNQHAVDTINRGEIHIVEPDLDIMVRTSVAEGYLRATTQPEPADVFLIAVPTPFLPSEGNSIPEPDLSFIKAASEAIAPVLKKGDLVILESTSPVGTTEKMADWMASARPDLTFPQIAGVSADVNIAYCPERVLPGHVVRELVENDRVIGGMSRKCSDRAVELYKTFVQGECVITNSRTAEMAKLTENSCRDVQIAFANELSIICDKLDIDVWELVALANRHPRINILQPGAGVGGHCIAVDPWFIAASAKNESQLIQTARQVNNFKPTWVSEKILENIRSKNKGLKVLCIGVSFKADIDDVRESPSVKIISSLLEKMDEYGFSLIVSEPNIPADHIFKFGGKSMKNSDLSSSIKGADLIVVLVNHKEISKIDFLNKEIINFSGKS